MEPDISCQCRLPLCKKGPEFETLDDSADMFDSIMAWPWEVLLALVVFVVLVGLLGAFFQ